MATCFARAAQQRAAGGGSAVAKAILNGLMRAGRKAAKQQAKPLSNT